MSLLSRVALGVAALGGVVRLSGEFQLHDDFNSVGIDREVDRRLDAYVPLVRKTRPILKDKFVSSRTLRNLAETWTAQIDAGKLETIMPAYHGESILEGPKSEAIRTCLALSNRMSELAVRELRTSSKPDQALRDTQTALKLINLVRYGSAETMVSAASYLVKPTFVLEYLNGKVAPEDLRLATATLIPDENDPRVVGMQHVERRQHLQYAIRYGTRQAKIDKSLFLGDLSKNRAHPSIFRAFGPFAKKSGTEAQSFASNAVIARNELQQ